MGSEEKGIPGALNIANYGKEKTHAREQVW